MKKLLLIFLLVLLFPGQAGAVEQARGFGATLGVASTDRIQSALTSHSVQRTYAIWAYPRAIGANASMVDKSNAGVQFERIQDSSDGTLTYQYKRAWSGGVAQWGAARPSGATWTHIVITYDGSSSSNAPSIYYNGVSQTVTTQIAATGTLSTNTDSYWLGNRGNGDRGWDGNLAEFAVWDRILTPTEITALSTGVGANCYSTSLVEYIKLNDNPVTSSVLSNPTVTGTAQQTGVTVDYTCGKTLGVTITVPTSSPTYDTTSSTLNLGGTSTLASSVTWANNRGGSGTATGTDTWSITGITLLSGANIITVTANGTGTATDTITATYTPAGPASVVGHRQIK